MGFRACQTKRELISFPCFFAQYILGDRKRLAEVISSLVNQIIIYSRPATPEDKFSWHEKRSSIYAFENIH